MTLRSWVTAAIVCANVAITSMYGADCTASLHRLDYSVQHSDLVLSLPVGLAVVSAPWTDVAALASAYRGALTQTHTAQRGQGKRSLIAGGPLLDSPDEAQIRECRREGDRIIVHVAHTSARLRGAKLRRNNPFRVLVEVPVTFEPGRYAIEVRWHAVESLPNGKALAEPVAVGPVALAL